MYTYTHTHIYIHVCVSLLFNLSFRKQTEAMMVAKTALQMEVKISLSYIFPLCISPHCTNFEILSANDNSENMVVYSRRLF